MKTGQVFDNHASRVLLASKLAGGLLFCTALTPLSAVAQQTTASEGGGAQVEEIVITAQRRAENLQSVPIAVSAMTAEQASAQGITGTLNLTSVAPSLQFNQTSNFGAVYLRGVGSNLADPTAEPSVATYIDGVYISSPQTNFFSFNNIERVEVLNGPQGTLFGRNATGGVIQVVTRDPSATPRGDISVGYGNYDDFTTSLYGSVGIAPNLAADLAIVYENQADGFGRNLTLNADTFENDNVGVRSKWLWTPGVGTEIRVTADYSRSNNYNAYQYAPGVVSPSYGSALFAGEYNAVSNLRQQVKNEGWGAALRWDQDMGPVKFTSITSRRESMPYFVLDSDEGPLTLGGSVYDSYVRNWSQEFQLANQSDGNLDWIVGLYYFDVVGGYDPWHSVGGGFFWRAEQTTTSWAGFGQATYHLDGGTSITGGLRYTTEDQDMWFRNLTIPANAGAYSSSHDKVTWRLALDHQFGDQVMGYLSYNRGFKSGGFNLIDTNALNHTPATQIEPSYNPEVVDAYEAGLKTDLFDRRLRLNGAVFYYDYTDIQLQQPVLVGNRVTNAASASIKGAEAQFEAALTEHFTLHGGFSVLDSEYKNFNPAPAVSANGVASVINASGNQLVAAPKWSGSLGVDYHTRIGDNSLTASVNAIHNDGFYWHPDNRLRQPEYTTVNASLTWGLNDDKYQIRLWGRNLSDATYYISEAEVSGRGDWIMQAAPRMYGVTLAAHY